jgi:serine/threonine-protein kinase
MSEAEAPQQDSQIGRMLLSQYRIEALIGEGGMGSVYRGIQLSVNRPVAIKLIAGKVAENPECVRRFRREAEAMAKLRHPNTVRLYEFGVADADSKHPELFMVMELLEGQDLSDHLARKQRLPAGEALSIARQTLEALSEAHAVGIVHRDLKPANIFLSQLHGGKLMAKVMDFGIAGIEQTGANTKLTMAGAVMGTPAYMSPEQAQGKAVDPRSDLYSLGVVLFEMLVGKPPFEADSAVSLLLAHVSTQPPKLHETGPDLHHPGVQQLLDGMLSKKPEQRPGSAAAAIEQIDVLLAQLGDPFSSARYSAIAANSSAPQKADPSSAQSTVVGTPSRFAKLGYSAAAVLITLLAAFFLWPRSETSAVEVHAPQPPKVESHGDTRAGPAPPAAVATYSVQILSKPAGASVELGGVEIGRTPYMLQFRRSTNLRVALTGYVSKLLAVDPGSDPLMVVELDPIQVARLKPTKKGVTDESPAVVPAQSAQPAQAAQALPPVAAAPPAAAVVVPGHAPPPHTAPGQPLGFGATSSPPPLVAQPPIAAQTQPKTLPPPIWVASSTPLQPRDRRQMMLQRGPPYPNVASAKRAYRAGQISEDVYDDTVWVLKTRRNERIHAEKLNYKQRLITRDEYNVRVDRIDAAYEGQ